MKVAVLGAAGGIGQALALLLKTSSQQVQNSPLRHRTSYSGVAADLSHIPTDVKVTGFAGEDANLH